MFIDANGFRHRGGYDNGIIGTEFDDTKSRTLPTRFIDGRLCFEAHRLSMMRQPVLYSLESRVKTEQMLEEIREANMSYLILAQHLIRNDKVEALYRLGISEEVADIIERLSTAQILKIAASNMLMCRLRFDDEMIWSLLTSHERDRGVAGAHAAILMAATLPEGA